MKKYTGNPTLDPNIMAAYIRRLTVLVLSSLSIILLTSQVSELQQPMGEYFGQEPPGLEPELFAQGIIPEDLHSSPIFAPDGKSVYYKPLGNDGIMHMRMKGDKWLPAIPVFVNDEVENSDDPCLNPKGDRLYFSLYDKEENREYIYFCSRNGDKKCVPKQPQGALNTLDLHWQFSIASNGNIYYSSNGNIYCSELLGEAYDEPYKLGESINSDLSEVTPYVSPDESMLIFSRSNNGKPDLFVSFKDEAGNWKQATALGPEVNSDHHEMCPTLSPDGKYLFFLSSRGGLFSAYWVDSKVLGAGY